MSTLPEWPLPIFNTLESLEQRTAPLPDYVNKADFEISREFLLAYRGSPDTFYSYRRDVDRFMQWIYLIAQMDIKCIGRQNIENYIQFCQKPPASWIATKMAPRFIASEGGVLCPNPDWRPYVAKVSKEAYQKGKKPSIKRYRLSDKGIQATLRILSTFFSFLEMEDYIQHNPVKRIRQKSRLVRTLSKQEPIRRLSDLQWDYVPAVA